MPGKGSFTQLLTDWRSGEPDALDRLTPLVYDELRRLAHKYMRHERDGHTLQATAVVNEAFMRLIQAEVPLEDSAHFFAVASRLMRRVLVDHAKARLRDKRYGALQRVPLDENQSAPVESGVDILDLDRAVQRLAQLQPRLAAVIELHYFGGLTYDQIAAAMESSAATVYRDIRIARAWLIDDLVEPP